MTDVQLERARERLYRELRDLRDATDECMQSVSYANNTLKGGDIEDTLEWQWRQVHNAARAYFRAIDNS